MASESILTNKLGMSRLVVLTCSAVILYVSGVMMIFAPLPIALSFMLYDKAKAVLATLLSLGLVYWLANVAFQAKELGATFFTTLYLFSVVIGILVSVIAKAKSKPIKGFVLGGLSFYLVTLSLTVMSIIAFKIPAKQMMVDWLVENSKELKKEEAAFLQNGGDQALDVLASLQNPEKLVDSLIYEIPSGYFILVFLVLWINLLLSLKARRIMFGSVKALTFEKRILNFKVLENVVWLFALGLFLAIFGGDLGYPKLEIIGTSMMKMIGVFYFFQGFGIYIAFLNKMKLFGFMRTVLVILTVMTAEKIVALVGLFDLWVNFRKYLRNS